MKNEARAAPYDSADYLDSAEAIAAYLKAAIEEGDAHDVRAALNAVARAMAVNRLVSSREQFKYFSGDR